MNKIEQLIKQFCPDGVEFKKTGDVCEVLRGKRLTKKELSQNEKYPVYHGGIEVLGYYKQYNRKANTTMIINTGSVGEVVYSFVDFWSSDGTFTIKTPEHINDRFLYFVLKIKESYLKTQKREGGVPTISKATIENIKIPIPPLPIQQEIVSILDKFTQLQAELETELEARRKQYEYYRDQLLQADEEGMMSSGVKAEWKTLGEIGKVSMCKRVMKHETSPMGDIPFYKIGTFGKNADAFITKELYDEYKRRFSFPKVGDILISASGTIGRTVVYDGKPAYFQDSNIVWIDNDESIVTNEFLFYYYKTVNWIIDGGTISRLYNSNLAKTKILIPPLSEQNRIVEILDKFDTLVNDTSIGIPAEIEARRKQYEYYRAKLLDFKECES